MSIYWVLLIFTGVCWLVSFAFMRETYAPVLLARRAKQLRKETGDMTIQTEQERHQSYGSEILVEAFVRPLVLLFTEPIMICFSASMLEHICRPCDCVVSLNFHLPQCLLYGLLYGFFFAYPIVFQEGHHFSYGETGLCFFGILIGISLVAIVGCPLQKRYYPRKVLEGNGETPPETRLPLMMVCALLLPASLFIFAWNSPSHISWVGPAVAGIPFGFSLVRIYISANTYLVDTFSRYSTSAVAAKTFIRSLAGDSMPMWISYMYHGWGKAWAGSLMAFVTVGMCPIPFVFFKYPNYQ